MKLFEIRMKIRQIIKEESEKFVHQDTLNFFSDLYKDVYGFRPNISEYKNLSVDEMSKEIEKLKKESEIQYKFEQEQEKKNIQSFEEKIKELIQMGAEDRLTALRWLFDAKDYYDTSDFLHDVGISYYSEKGKQIEKELEDAFKNVN